MNNRSFNNKERKNVSNRNQNKDRLSIYYEILFYNVTSGYIS